jgi:hypothetical protein
MTETQPANTGTQEGLGRRAFMAMLGTPLLLGAAAYVTNGAPFTNLGIHEKLGDPFRRDENPLKPEGGRTALRSKIYEDKAHSTWRVDYAAHGVIPQVSYTCDDKGVLEAAVLFAENEAPFHLCREKSTLLDRVIEEKHILDRLSGKDRHITLDDAKKAGVRLEDYVKPYDKLETSR